MDLVTKFCEENLVYRKNTNSLKWDALEARYGDANLLPLWVADMEFKAPKGVIDALVKRSEHGVFGYTEIPDSYYEAFFNWQKSRYGVSLEREWVSFSPGVVSSFYAMVQAYSQVGEGVIILSPVYYPFFHAVRDGKRQLVTSELVNEAGDYRINFADFEQKIIENDVKVFIHCSPHNPVGRVWDESELVQLFDICIKHNVVIVSDEIHQDLTRGENPFISALKLDQKYFEKLIVLNSPSKTFNVACLLHSHIIIPNEELRSTYEAYLKMVSPPEISVMGMIAAEAAYRTGSDWLEGLLAVIEANYQTVVQAFSEKAPKIIVSPKQGTYLLWIDLRGYLSPDEVKVFIQDKCGLAIDFGDWFGEESKGFIRINLGTDPQFIKEATAKMIQVLETDYL